jgi:N-acetyl-alpha-D-glucosaminyl L-malate synthase BshA
VNVFGIERPIRVISNFVNCDTYQPQPERRPQQKTLLHISNFRAVKRVTDCVRILGEVRREVDAHLWMAGDGPERGPAERLARELALERHITFLGKQDHVERLIPQAHVLLLPSEMESFGLVALEAMACGVPPVATRVGGVPELVTHGADGFLEGVGDVAAQARRVIELLSNPQLFARISGAARTTAQTRFCASMVIPLYECYYTDTITAGAT